MNNSETETEYKEIPDLWEILETTSDPALKNAIGKMNIGRPVEYTEQIGGFICNLLSVGKTIQNIIDIYNKNVPDTKLTKYKIYSWLKNPKLKEFTNHYYFAREVSTNGILDDMIKLEDDIITDTVSFKSGRVVLESKRWRAKVCNPKYFNPVSKDEVDHKHEIIIKANIPLPLPLPAQLQVRDPSLDEVIDVVPDPDLSQEGTGDLDHESI